MAILEDRSGITKSVTRELQVFRFTKHTKTKNTLFANIMVKTENRECRKSYTTNLLVIFFPHHIKQ